jgi:hypothetical protein
MVRIKRRTEITVETETRLVVRRGAEPPRVWCARCGAESQMLTPREAALISGVSTRRIYARVEEGALHFRELPDGTLLVCGRSVGPNQH